MKSEDSTAGAAALVMGSAASGIEGDLLPAFITLICLSIALIFSGNSK